MVRALIVLLIVLNLGVAAWWVLDARSTRPVAPAQVAATAGVTRLQLVDEGAISAKPATAWRDSADVRADVAPPAVPGTCVSFGPFADAAAASQARQRLQRGAGRATVREAFSGPVRGWNVSLPPFPSTTQAEAAAAHIVAAGFEDYFIVREGNAANSVALGRYGSEASARRRVAVLAAAGFPAIAQPIRTGNAEHWVDFAAVAGLDIAGAHALVGAPGQTALDCATLN